MEFTQRQLTILFHILNNIHGECIEIEAPSRALAIDGITREEFFFEFTQIKLILLYSGS